MKIKSSYLFFALMLHAFTYSFAEAEDDFAVINSNFEDGISTYIYATDPSSHTFRGYSYSSENNSYVPLEVVILDPENVENVSESVTGEYTFLSSQDDSMMKAERVFNTFWEDDSVYQLEYIVSSTVEISSDGVLESDFSSTGRVSIVHDPFPVAVMVFVGGAALMCNANYIYSIHSDSCPNANLEISIAPPRCNVTCSE